MSNLILASTDSCMLGHCADAAEVGSSYASCHMHQAVLAAHHIPQYPIAAAAAAAAAAEQAVLSSSVQCQHAEGTAFCMHKR